MSVTGFCFSGMVKVGSNGTLFGSPELRVGKPGTTLSVGRKTWDANVQNGIDSDWVPVTLTAKAGGGTGGVTLEAGGTPVVHSGVQYGPITKVALGAMVAGGGKRASFRSAAANFYDADADDEPAATLELSDASCPIASTWSTSDPAAGDEQSVDLTPSGSYAKVVVTAEVRLENAEAELPDPDSIACTIYVFTESCS